MTTDTKLLFEYTILMATRSGESRLATWSEVDLQEHRDKSTETLSGGLRRRVLLGIAAVADSPLLILDEPSAGLDPEARRDLWDLLRSYRQRGKTVLPGVESVTPRKTPSGTRSGWGVSLTVAPSAPS